MDQIERFLTTPMADAIGWALIHLLWQGMLVASAVALVLRALSRSTANARYLVALAGLVVISVIPFVTAWRVYQSPAVASPAEVASALSAPIAVASGPVTPPSSDGAAAWLSRARVTAEHSLPWVVGIWFAGVIFFSVRLFLAWSGTQRLRKSAAAASREWKERLMVLQAKISLRKRVELLESAAVDVPMVIGWLRPVVLVPVSAVSGLSIQQLETILAHELAHIRRHDFVVNMFQAVVETLLFYHPAVWWLSDRIRVERENCCDDLAVAVCGDPLFYARALTEMETLRAHVPVPALAATGGSLRERVLRLIGAPAGACSHRWVTGASLTILLLVIAIVAVPLSLLAHDQPKAAKKAGSEVEVVAPVEGVESSQSASAAPAAASLIRQMPEVDIQAIAEIAREAAGEAVADSDPDIDTDADSDNDDVDEETEKDKAKEKEKEKGAKSDVDDVIDELITARIAGVDAKYIERMRQLGYEASLKELASAKLVGVTTQFAEQANAYGFGKLTLKQLKEFSIHGVTPEYLAELRAAGLGEITARKATKARIHGITGQYISEMRSAGYSNLTFDELISFGVAGVTKEYIAAIRQAGFANVNAKELARMKMMGVDADYIRDLKQYKKR